MQAREGEEREGKGREYWASLCAESQDAYVVVMSCLGEGCLVGWWEWGNLLLHGLAQ